MKRSKGFLWLAGGIACVLLAALACGYSLIYNEGRLVYPMDLSTYVFRPADLPMILAITAVIVYALVLCGLLIRGILHNKEQVERTKTTRKLNPKLGFLGFLGLLLGHGLFLGSTEYTLIIVTCTLSLTVALVQFLSIYLLYRYDRDDQLDDEEEGNGGV